MSLTRSVSFGEAVPTARNGCNSHLPPWLRTSAPLARCQQVVFKGESPAHKGGIYLVPFDGGAPQLLPIEPKPEKLIEPAWSPDGGSLALGANPVVGSPPSRVRLYRFDLATNRLSPLPGSEGLWSPRWSPDGKSLWAISFPEWKLALYNLDNAQAGILDGLRRWLPELVA